MASAIQLPESSSSPSVRWMLLNLTTIIIIMIITISAVPSSRCCPDDQKAAILEYYHSVLGANLSVLDHDGYHWDASSSCCEWPGVKCDQDTKPAGVVVEFQPPLGASSEVNSDVLTPLFRLTTLEALYLVGQNIRGEIPPGVGNLTRLRVFCMSYNHLSGPIPPQFFGNLTNLEVICLQYNELSGEIPQGFIQLNKLEELYLTGNSLTGKIPSAIGYMYNLTRLVVDDNHLTGNIPLSFQYMSQLQEFHVHNNLLSGEIPTWLFDLPALESLYLGNNSLTLSNAGDMVPKAPIEDLSLRSCNISGPIPSWLSKYPFFYYLNLSNNRITGTIPLWMAKMLIFQLLLANNLLQGSVPAELFTYPHGQSEKRHLDLSYNKLEGKLTDVDANQCDTNNKYFALVLSDNNLSGPLPFCIANMSTLRLLDVSRNQFSGEVFQVLCHNEDSCPNYIDLSFNSFHGHVSIPYADVLELSHNNFSTIKLLHDPGAGRLKVLDLHDNQISGEIPDFLSQISSLRILTLQNNLLQGSIPETLSNLTKLQILDLSRNKLSGRIPNSFGNLTGMTIYPQDSSIRTMAFDDNNYYSDDQNTFIPLLEVFWKLLPLGLPTKHIGLYTFLDLSSNLISGEIPESLGNLKSLKVLNISHNQLSGRIPATIGDIENLESLDLSHNKLHGIIPEAMGRLHQLTSLQLSDNNLTGRIPSGPQMDRMNNPNTYANNDKGLCGMQIQESCTKAMTTPVAAKNGEGTADDDEEGLWFSWMTAGIGYPAGFVTTVLGMYGFGYFHVSTWRC